MYVNFAVASRHALCSMGEESGEIFPGINTGFIAIVSSQMQNNAVKLAVDGKKIERGKGKVMGDINCLGHEHKPTLEDKKKQSKEELSASNDLTQMLMLLCDRGIDYVQNIENIQKYQIVSNMYTLLKSMAASIEQLRHTLLHLNLSETNFKIIEGEDWKDSDMIAYHLISILGGLLIKLMFDSESSIDKNFLKSDLLICITALQVDLSLLGLKFAKSWKTHLFFIRTC